MVKRHITLLLLVILLAAVPAVAQEVTVNAPRSVVEGNMFQVVFEIENARATDIKTGKIEGCTELSGPGVTSSSSVTIVNGRRTSTSSTGYAYTYRAVKAGVYTIPPATLTVDGKQIQSKPVQIKVLQPDSSSPGASGNQSGASSPDRRAASASQEISANDIFVRIIFNKSHVYEGEAVECTLKLYTRYNSINGIIPQKLPTFDGFLIDEVDVTSQENELEHYNGNNYITAILKKYIIFPQTSGTLTVTSGEYTVGVTTMQRVSAGFWGYTNVPVEQEVNLRPTSATLNITPLPEPHPASFNGAVGSFTIDSRLSSEQLRTNEATSITTVITGTGNIKYVKCPTLELPVDFEQYTPSEDVNTRVQGNTVTGTVTAEYTFVPQSVGTFNIPPIEFSYFDPSKREYVTLTTGGYDVDVARGASTTTGVTEQNEIRQRATDILHIHRLDSTDDLKPLDRHAPTIYNVGFWIVWLAVVAAAAAVLFLYRRHVRLSADVTGRRTARAGRVAKKRLRRARAFMAAGKNEEFYAEVLNALWGYISDRLVIPASELTRNNVSERLAERGMSKENIVRIIDILDECEMARYTPAAAARTPQQIYEATSDAMDTLEALNRRRTAK